MEDRANRLRNLIVAQFLDEVQASLIELEQLRDSTCLKVMTPCFSPTVATEEVNYEDMLDSLGEDLKIVHTVPLALRRVSQREIKELEMESSGKIVMAVKFVPRVLNGFLALKPAQKPKLFQFHILTHPYRYIYVYIIHT